MKIQTVLFVKVPYETVPQKILFEKNSGKQG